MSDPQIDAAVAKLEAMRLDELTDLFDPAHLAVLVSVKAANRATFEKLMVRWKQMGFSAWHDLKIEVGRLEKTLSAGGGHGGGDPLDPQAPLATAKRFVAEMHPTLLWYHSDWLLHRGTHYEVVEPDKVKGDIYAFIEKTCGFAPDAKSVGNVIDALKGVVLVERGSFEPPCWLKEDELGLDYPADEILACSNGLLHLPTGTLMESTPGSSPATACPTTTIQPRRSRNAGCGSSMRCGATIPSRSPCCRRFSAICSRPTPRCRSSSCSSARPAGGKGTITKVLTKLVGKRSVCSPTLAKFGERFGLEAALGKQLATVSDMRLGRKTDRQEIVGNILRIVGEDDIDVERKHIGGAVTGKLAIRIVISSNLLPPLPDVSGALVARLITLTMKRSFLGTEDLTLDRKLEAELPGILNWAIEGWRRLKAQGHFTVTAESSGTAQKIADLASPLNAFLRDCCVLEAGAMEPRSKVWRRFESYVLANDLPPTYTSSNYFHRDLEVAAQHRITMSRPRVDGKQVSHWVGLRLLPATDADDFETETESA